MLNRFFDLAAKGTTVRTEVVAGFTTFLTMAYIIAVNPAILSQTGMPVAGVAAATCFCAAFASILMGLVANYPLALAPGMGLNAYFTYTVVLGMGVSWRVALGCVFLSGLGFLFLTVVGLRRLIVEAIPKQLFAALSGGIGLFIALIGLKSANIIVTSPVLGLALGDLTKPGVCVALFGLMVMAALEIRRIKGAVLIGILASTGLALLIGATRFSFSAYDLSALSATAFQLDIPGALGLKGGKAMGLFEIVFIFLFVDVFDNIGTLAAVTKRAGLTAPDGSIPRLNRILAADSAAALVGAMAGTSTVVSYVESAAGVSVGGRTGLTAIVVGLLFLAAAFVAPLAQLIPAAATAPALIMVGAMMMMPLAEIEWKNPLLALPAFLTFALIPLTYSIANGLAAGVTSMAVLKLVAGRLKRSDALLVGLAVLFVLRFVYLGSH